MQRQSMPFFHERKFVRKRGQAILFVLMALVVLLVVFLWMVDVHLLFTGKTKAQNAGDAAAVAAARWQANTLNMIGELNLMQVAALDVLDYDAIDAIQNMQARLCFTGPLTGLKASQVVAKKNGAKVRGEFTKLLKKHAGEVLHYKNPVGGAILFPEPYPNAWQEYYDALMAIVEDGIAVAPDNARFFGDVTSGHILLDKSFYEAVAGRSWCWFFLNHLTGGRQSTRTILDDFTDYRYFGPIPEPSPPLYRNSEIFGIGASIQTLRLDQVGGLEDWIRERFDEEGGSIPVGTQMTTNAFSIPCNWYVYDESIWSGYWPGMTYGEEEFLPLTGSVREEYNYTGADSVTRLYMGTKMFSSPDSGKDDWKEMVWTAAAKPFGFLVEAREGSRIRPNTYGLILPAFQDIRLIPMDSATMGSDGSFDIDWREHTDEHLVDYCSSGTLREGCRYCRLIRRFENPEFRKAGSEWLSKNSNLCTLPSATGGTHRGGGTRRGH